MPFLTRRLWPFAIVVSLYMVAALFLAVRQWNIEFLYYGMVLWVTIAGVAWLDSRVRLPAWLLWALTVWGLLHMFGGTIHIPEPWAEPGSSGTLYNLRVRPWLPRYDQVVHGYGFGVAALTAWRGLRAMLAEQGTAGVGLWVVVWLLGMGVGALNEVVEFVATEIMPWTNVGGYENTGWDLVADAVGCAVAATWANSAVHSTPSFRLETARPMDTLSDIGIVTAFSSVQFTPSEDL